MGAQGIGDAIGGAIQGLIGLLIAAAVAIVVLIGVGIYGLFFKASAADMVNEAASYCPTEMAASEATGATECSVGLKLIFKDGEVIAHHWQTD